MEEEPISAPPSEPAALPPEPSVAPSEPNPLPPEPSVAPSEPEPSAASVVPTPEPTKPAAFSVERVRKKRKLEDLSFHNSTYYKIRKIVRNLRPSFVQLYQNPSFRETNLAGDILKEIKTVLELSKQLRTDLALVTEHRKTSSIPPSKDEPTEAFQRGSMIPPTQQSENVKGVPNSNINISSEEVRVEPKDVPFNLDDGLKGSYVVGGSPVGRNFLVYPGSKPMYYGRTKAEKQAHQIEN